VRRHPLVALILRSRHYRILISGFILRMTGAYTATLAAVWGAWRYGSPARAAWLVAIISIASALGALWVGHRHDHGSARPVLRAAGALEAVAATVLALAGTRAVPDALLLTAGAAAGIARAVWSAAVTPALADAAGDDRAVGAFGVGWAFDIGKLAGAVLLAGVLLAPATSVLVPVAIVIGTVMFTRFAIAPAPAATPVTASTDTPTERAVVKRADVNRGIAMMAIAAFCLYQQDLLFRVAIDTPAMYAVAAAAFAVGAIAATAQLAWHAPGRLPTRAGLVASLVACALGTAGLLLASGAGAAASGLVIGWGCAYGIQGCRPLFAWAPRPGFSSGVSIALMTVATATGAPVVVELLPHLGPAVVLIGGSVVLAALCAPDVHTAAGAAASSPSVGASPP
jgi:MFS family permease